MRHKLLPFLRRVRKSFEDRTGPQLPGPHVPSGERPALSPERSSFPTQPDELRASELYRGGWYYSVELLPGVLARGLYPDDLPMTPRVILRNCDLTGMSCLDVGTMEGLIPVLMRRMGAARVLGVDSIDHCALKLEALQHYYAVDFDFKACGFMYALDESLNGEGFDLINLSGLLYHVFSPLLVLCGVRPLLKRNGLIVISTGIIFDPGHHMEFNNAGRIQEEANTFWYMSVGLLDYILRYLKLAPIDCVHLRHSERDWHVRLRFDRPSGYVSVVCRAVDDVLPASDDKWMKASAGSSCEHAGMVDWETAAQQANSSIEYKGNKRRNFFRTDTNAMDLWEAVQGLPALNVARSHADSHTLRLSDQS